MEKYERQRAKIRLALSHVGALGQLDDEVFLFVMRATRLQKVTYTICGGTRLKKDNINFSLLMIIINFHDGYNIKTMHYKHIAIILEIKAGYLELYNKLESILHKKE